MILNVTKANYIDDFKIRILFNDGVDKIIDFKEYINKKKHPFFQPLKNTNEFKKFHIHKTIVWDTGADIAPEYMHDIL